MSQTPLLDAIHERYHPQYDAGEKHRALVELITALEPALAETQAACLRLRQAMPPSERLRNIALWFDYQYPGKSSEMQDTLRTWADAIDRALEAA